MADADGTVGRCSNPESADQFFRDFIDGQSARVLGYLRRARPTDDELDDLLQDVWTLAWLRCDAMPAQGDTWPWLLECCRDARAEFDRRRRASSGTCDLPDVAAPSPSSEEDAWARCAREDWVRELVDKLPPRMREAIKQTRLQGETIQETADALNRKAGTIKAQTFAGLKALRRIANSSPPPPRRQRRQVTTKPFSPNARFV